MHNTCTLSHATKCEEASSKMLVTVELRMIYATKCKETIKHD